MSLPEDDPEPTAYADDPAGDPTLRALFSAARRDLPAIDATRIVTKATSSRPWLKLAVGGASVVSVLLVVALFTLRADREPDRRQPAGDRSVSTVAQPVPRVESPVSAAVPQGAEPDRSATHLAAPGHRAIGRAQPQPAERRASDELAEGSVLLRARRALAAGDLAAALAAVHEHEVRFARGRLTPEREAIAIDALVSSGRASEARARAARFLDAWPDSPYAARARRALGQ